MRRTNLIILSAIVLSFVGCATQEAELHKPREYFHFNQDPNSGFWRPRFDDFIGTAKAYAKRNNIPFDFNGTSASLTIFVKDGQLIARVEFFGKVGAPFLTLDMDTSGKVLRHYTGLSTD
jgi:hypothetical protein